MDLLVKLIKGETEKDIHNFITNLKEPIKAAGLRENVPF